MTDGQPNERKLAQSVVASASPAQRAALLAWAIELSEIRNSAIAALSKARRAVEATAKRKILAPIIKANLQRTADLVWNERSWPTRLGMLGLTVGTLGFSGQLAGLAAFGRAIAVPIWLVLTAGGTLLGAIIQELEGGSAQSPRSTTYSVIEAHKDTDT